MTQAVDDTMFVFAGVYADIASAEGDYEVIKLLHTCDEIGSYDAAVLGKQSDGAVAVHKSGKPTPRVAWTGIAASAVSAVACPSLLPGLVESGSAGAGLSAWLDHVARGISRADSNEIGALLEEDRAALVVVGIETDAARIEQTAAEAIKSVVKRLDADFDAAEREAAQARMPTAPFTDR